MGDLADLAPAAGALREVHLVVYCVGVYTGACDHLVNLRVRDPGRPSSDGDDARHARFVDARVHHVDADHAGGAEDRDRDTTGGHREDYRSRSRRAGSIRSAIML